MLEVAVGNGGLEGRPVLRGCGAVVGRADEGRVVFALQALPVGQHHVEQFAVGEAARVQPRLQRFVVGLGQALEDGVETHLLDLAVTGHTHHHGGDEGGLHGDLELLGHRVLFLVS
ncbi:hypothetical protein D3C72_2053130 [compost metagenome]